jgi:hypothetical protein
VFAGHPAAMYHLARMNELGLGRVYCPTAVSLYRKVAETAWWPELVDAVHSSHVTHISCFYLYLSISSTRIRRIRRRARKSVVWFPERTLSVDRCF